MNNTTAREISTFKDSDHKVFGCCMTLQDFFANKAKLKHLKSLKPKPPSCFLLHRLDHLTQLIFLSLIPELHQNLLYFLEATSEIDLGRRKHDMEYARRA
uniref:Uncharacterized protein n=1 Tax=Nelumbo nucifera TaxID=4432 RepID=A0A822XIZ1_NELNU|nr:TPA_asm: hypothetical protein HUJ06_021136 [Nelumbo nucifera]